MDDQREMDELTRAAAATASAAYAPYSGFRVGAALRAASGTVYTGVNVENASYGLSMCAERVALYRAIAAGEREFTAIAVAAAGGADAAPCGACRQALMEFSPEMNVSYRSDGAVAVVPLNELLPDAFRGGRSDRS